MTHGCVRIGSKLGFFSFFKHKFFLPFFLWQVGEFSLVCEAGREGRREGERKKKVVCSEVCSAHVALSQLFTSRPNREKEKDLKEAKKKKRKKKKRKRQRENRQNVSVREKEKRERRVEESRLREGFDYTQIWPLPARRETL